MDEVYRVPGGKGAGYEFSEDIWTSLISVDRLDLH